MSWLKDSAATLDYAIDWAAWLGTDTIASHTVTPDTGITAASSSATTTTVTVWLTGGTDGEDYDVVCRVVTAAGRTDERTLKIKVRNR